MTQSNTNPNIPDQVERLAELIQSSETFSQVYENLAATILERVESRLTGFEEVLKDSNLSTIDYLQDQLNQVKEDNRTFNGVLERLKTAVAPDVTSAPDEVTNFRDAIENLGRYGSIIPTQSDISFYNQRHQEHRSWSLLRQTFARFLVWQVQRHFDGRGKRDS